VSLKRTGADRVPATVEHADDGLVGRLVQVLLDAGIDGLGPLKSARELAEAARRETRTTEGAVKKIVRSHVVKGGVGGFVTSVGGFLEIGSITTAAQAGAEFSFHLIWAIVLGGLSMGGYVALALMARNPERVRGLMLMDTRASPLSRAISRAAGTPFPETSPRRTASRPSGSGTKS